jgi:hypothetical protein
MLGIGSSVSGSDSSLLGVNPGCLFDFGGAFGSPDFEGFGPEEEVEGLDDLGPDEDAEGLDDLEDEDFEGVGPEEVEGLDDFEDEVEDPFFSFFCSAFGVSSQLPDWQPSPQWSLVVPHHPHFEQQDPDAQVAPPKSLPQRRSLRMFSVFSAFGGDFGGALSKQFPDWQPLPQ